MDFVNGSCFRSKFSRRQTLPMEADRFQNLAAENSSTPILLNMNRLFLSAWSFLWERLNHTRCMSIWLTDSTKISIGAIHELDNRDHCTLWFDQSSYRNRGNRSLGTPRLFCESVAFKTSG